jgi:pimeloyl-ACP methyl ester carboxylesterase
VSRWVGQQREVHDRQLTNESRLNLVAEHSRSRRVEGKRTLLDFDVTDVLDDVELDKFRKKTGLSRSPVTLVLPDQFEAGTGRGEHPDRVVVAFLHGFGGSRRSWGIDSSTAGVQKDLVSAVLRAVENLGREAIGLVVAGLGRDGGTMEASTRELGLTPDHYSCQLHYVLRYLGLYDCGRIVAIGHSVGAAALWEFARHRLAANSGPEEQRPGLSVVSISPVRALADSPGLRLGCQVAGQGLDLLMRSLLSLWRFSSGRVWDLLGMASVLKGLAQEGSFSADLAGVKGLVLVGQRDWIARRGLKACLQQAGCAWPVAQLTGLGHNLLWHPATVRALVSYMPTLL